MKSLTHKTRTFRFLLKKQRFLYLKLLFSTPIIYCLLILLFIKSSSTILNGSGECSKSNAPFCEIWKEIKSSLYFFCKIMHPLFSMLPQIYTEPELQIPASRNHWDAVNTDSIKTLKMFASSKSQKGWFIINIRSDFVLLLKQY